MRRRLVAPALVLVVALGMAEPSAGEATGAAGKTSAVASARSTVVGELTLRPCKVAPRALCGSIRRQWDPLDRQVGTVAVGFAFVPARVKSKPAIGTLVPHEGGPGYSTTGTTWYGERLAVDLRVRSRRLRGVLHGGWDTTARGAVAVLEGTLGGRAVRLWSRAP